MKFFQRMSRTRNLVKAIRNGNLQKTQHLIQEGQDINGKIGSDGNSPLHIAVQHDNDKIVQYLLENGAVISNRNNRDDTVLHIVCRDCNLHLLKILLSTEKVSDALGNDIFTGNIDGDTPLHLAVRGGIVEVVHSLLRITSSMSNLKNNDGETPLLTAFLGYDQRPGTDVEELKAIVELLVAYGASVNQGNNKQFGPLHSAAYIGDKELISFLIGKGAHLDACAEGGLTPLGVAALTGNLATCRILISAGADINVKNAEGHSLLTLCKARNLLTVVDLLRTSGAVE